MDNREIKNRFVKFTEEKKLKVRRVIKHIGDVDIETEKHAKHGRTKLHFMLDREVYENLKEEARIQQRFDQWKNHGEDAPGFPETADGTDEFYLGGFEGSLVLISAIQE